MGYMHINNLYKDQTILNFKRVYALEKCHGTSAHISWHDGQVHFFSGGASSPVFCALFDREALKAKFEELGYEKVIINGEAYGGSEQGMRLTYGDKLKFIVFDVRVGDTWLNVPNAEDFAHKFGLEFVHYVECSTDFVVKENEDGTKEYICPELDRERDAPSVQAVRNGIVEPKPREGIVIRPLQEFIRSNGDRVIVKHKGAAFSETATTRKIKDPADVKVIEEAQAAAAEFVTTTRLEHVLDHLKADLGREVEIKDTGMVINAMVEDVLREAVGEIVEGKETEKAIGTRARQLFHQHLKRITTDTES